MSQNSWPIVTITSKTVLMRAEWKDNEAKQGKKIRTEEVFCLRKERPTVNSSVMHGTQF